MIPLASLAVFSGLSLNILLQFALGAPDVAVDGSHKKNINRDLPLVQLAILFISVLFLWMFFSYLFPAFLRGFFEYFLFFPFSALFCMGFEFLIEKLVPRVLPNFDRIKKTFSAFTAYDGLVPTSLILTTYAASTFADAFVLALFFAFGNLTATLILNEIRRRSSLEWIPRYLRGTPLVLVSMGLLSLISASVAGIFFKMLEVF
ncbi:MAG: hypothetical protein LBH42_10700 [Treponema sp.]|jgi:electron transport complex protein RnfA|nr:hypothetical protein [Treponema sp.]